MSMTEATAAATNLQGPRKRQHENTWPDEEKQVQENVSRVIAGLLGVRRMNQTEMGRHLGTHQSAISDKLNNRVRWSVYDLQRVAQALDVSVAILFEDPEDVFRSRCFALVSTPDGQLEMAPPVPAPSLTVVR